MAGQLRVDEITDEAGTGSPSFPFGLPVGYAAGGTAPAAGSFTEVPDDVLEPGKPIRSVDTLALRDNPIAIAGGAAGAPRIVTNAINNSAVTTAKIADANVTTAKLATNERMTTANVLSATAGAAARAVGTYADAFSVSGAVGIGNTIAGSSLRGAAGLSTTNPSFTGTWRAMGASSAQRSDSRCTFLRIS